MGLLRIRMKNAFPTMALRRGEVVDLPSDVADDLVGLGYAEYVDPLAAETAMLDPRAEER